MRICSDGFVGIGTATLTHAIQLSGGTYSDGAQRTDTLSRELKENIINLSTEEANKTLKEHTPVKYNYETDKEDRHVAFIVEDVPELVASKDRKGISPMDIVAVMTTMVQEQRQTIEEQQKAFTDLAITVSQLKAEVQRLKAMSVTAMQ